MRRSRTLCIEDCDIGSIYHPLSPSHLARLQASSIFRLIMSEMMKGKPRTTIGLIDDSSKKQMTKSAVTQENSFVPNTQMERKRSFESTTDERDDQGQDRATIQIDGKLQPTAPHSPPQKASLSAQALAGGDNAMSFDWMGEGRFHLTGHSHPETKRGSSPAGYHEFKHRNSPTSQVRL
jgi:hypothetical protein